MNKFETPLTWEIHRNGDLFSASTNDIPQHHQENLSHEIQYFIYLPRSEKATHKQTPSDTFDKINRNNRRGTLSTAKIISHAIDGTYISILINKNDGEIIILPDPTSGVKIFYKYANGILRFSTDINCVINQASLDWDYSHLVSFARTQFSPPGSTAFEKIYVISPGCGLRISRNLNISQILIWSPRIDGKNRTKDDLIEAVADCLETRVNRKSKLCLSLSGGVDSSACGIFLADKFSKENFSTCVHFYSTRSSEFYEVKLAEAVSNLIDRNLEKIDIDNHLPFDKLISSEAPSILNQNMLYISLEEEIIRRVGENVTLVEGQGGDLLFDALPQFKILTELFFSKNWRKTLSVAKTLAILHNESLPRVLCIALHDSIASIRTTPEISNLAIWPTKRLKYRNPNNLTYSMPSLRNKYLDIQSLLSTLSSNEINCKLQRYFPFLDRRIIEIAFNTPIEHSFNNFNDRLILREAAFKINPCHAIWRKSKGSLDAGVIQGINKNISSFRDLIFNGNLHKQHLIDSALTEEAIKNVKFGSRIHGIQLALLGCVEIFCNTWTHRRSEFTPPPLEFKPINSILN
ncbi:asparagine synthase C-terminal domain-containing protein [Burkholderia gladioli]|uniref:asparagine synthase (glutamine-hydrolyzing) n=1 Tax=Burkholderia gladioli (strain BSR3) TaxID=999541 RepID=F2LFM3_BURGS|nr:asparagine synthase C-terminal domain-containing protein [Burkholderia gladioli]AEA61657.1 Asparagine synthase family [Burkholderia gladioli BSR3]MBW5283400.1 asparagine synthase [Burkholderia gladioli]